MFNAKKVSFFEFLIFTLNNKRKPRKIKTPLKTKKKVAVSSRNLMNKNKTQKNATVINIFGSLKT